VFACDRMVVANAYNWLTQTPSRAATELRASVWTARSLLALWGTRHTSKAAASCARSKRFALFAALPPRRPLNYLVAGATGWIEKESKHPSAPVAPPKVTPAALTFWGCWNRFP
jgi:hypothetical protein